MPRKVLERLSVTMGLVQAAFTPTQINALYEMGVLVLHDHSAAYYVYPERIVERLLYVADRNNGTKTKDQKTND